MLYLVGLGIGDEKDISVRGLEILKSCDEIFFEIYTNVLDSETKGRLENMAGKPILAVDRKEVEEGSRIIESAKSKKTALVVPGDPLIATTHAILLSHAIDKGIEYKVIHASSVFSAAIGESGLHVYKFGNSVTIPKWYDNYKPASPYDVVAANKERGLHTLLLIDIFEGKNLPIEEVAQTLGEMEKMKEGGLFKDDVMLAVMSRIGHDDFRMFYVSLGDITKAKDMVKHPYVIIYPGKLHFTEEEWLERFIVR